MVEKNLNMELSRRLDTMINSGRFFHACIISGVRELLLRGEADGDGAQEVTIVNPVVMQLVKAAVCSDDTKKPCGICGGCRKAERHTHPDIDIVERQGAELVVGQIREVREKVFTRPNEAPRRVVLIAEAEKMNRSAQNALLNILEEPPSDVLFILVTENEDGLLPTIRSRCAVLRYREPVTGEYSEQAASLLEDYLNNGRRELLGMAQKLERMKRDELRNFIESVRASAVTRLMERSDKRLAALIDRCNELERYLEANVNPGMAAGAFIAFLLDNIGAS